MYSIFYYKSGNADHLKEWIDTTQGIDVVITSIRDGGDAMRDYMLNTLAINTATDTVDEIPLAKITRRGDHFQLALDWYKDTMLAHITRILRLAPFDL